MKIDSKEFIGLSNELFLKHYEKLPEQFFTTENDKRLQSIMLLVQLQDEAINGRELDAIKHLILMVENLMFYKMDDILKVAEAEARARIKKSISGQKTKGYRVSDRQRVLAYYEEAEARGIPPDEAKKSVGRQFPDISPVKRRQYKSNYIKGHRAKKDK